MTRSEIIFIVFNVLWLVLSFTGHAYIHVHEKNPTPDRQCAHPEQSNEPWPDVEDSDPPQDDRCRCSRDG